MISLIMLFPRLLVIILREWLLPRWTLTLFSRRIPRTLFAPLFLFRMASVHHRLACLVIRSTHPYGLNLTFLRTPMITMSLSFLGSVQISRPLLVPNMEYITLFPPFVPFYNLSLRTFPRPLLYRTLVMNILARRGRRILFLFRVSPGKFVD